MKSESHNDAFQPVKLILESQAEVDAIFAVLNNCRVRQAIELPQDSYRALDDHDDWHNAHRLHLKLVDLTTKPQDCVDTFRGRGPDVAIKQEPQWVYFIHKGNHRTYRISTAWTSEQPAQVVDDVGGHVWINSSFLAREVTGDYADRFQKLDDLPIKSSVDLHHLVPEKAVAPYVYFAKSSIDTSIPGIYRFPVSADRTDNAEVWYRQDKCWKESIWRVGKIQRFATNFFPISEDKAQGFLK
jgi:hypothetical protein